VVFDLYGSLADKLRIPLSPLCGPWIFDFLIVLIVYVVAGTAAFGGVGVTTTLVPLILVRPLLDLLHRMYHSLL
jgi:hypothetical protein